MEIVIHIGFPKTGSSAIQAHLPTNWQWFKKRGLVIPKSGFTPGSGHNLLFDVTDTQNARPELAAYLGDRGFLPELLIEIEDYSKQGCDRVLLTWEGFALLDHTLIEKFASAFSGHSVRLLAYLREQCELVESMILQRVKSTQWKSPLFDYLEEKMATPAPGFLDFYDVLSNWNQIFAGRLAIETRVYAREALVENDIVVDFAHWLGLPIDDNFALQPTGTNVSLDANGAALASLASAAGLDRQGKTVLVQALLRDITAHGGGTRSFLPDTTLARIRAQYQQSNQRVQRDFPPRNQDPAHSGDLFAQTARDVRRQPDTFLQLACRLNSLISNPERALWLGEKLDKHGIAAVTKSIGGGWRRPGNKGIWSVDECSDIMFRIPRVSLGDRPVYLLLAVRGRYYGANKSTRVEFGVNCSRHDLSNTTLRLPVDESVLSHGIHLTLLHDKPISPMELENKKDTGRLAFMLHSLSYEFSWE